MSGAACRIALLPNVLRHILVFAVIDANLAEKSPAAGSVCAMLKERNVPSYAVEASEQAKNMETVLGICSWLMDCNAGRDALVLAIGGGITTDMTGFAASVYKRGVRFAYVPTTLLAQVDASVGGKTGVNFEQYKNMLGIIRQPGSLHMSISGCWARCHIGIFFPGQPRC